MGTEKKRREERERERREKDRQTDREPVERQERAGGADDIRIRNHFAPIVVQGDEEYIGLAGDHVAPQGTILRRTHHTTIEHMTTIEDRTSVSLDGLRTGWIAHWMDCTQDGLHWASQCSLHCTGLALPA